MKKFKLNEYKISLIVYWIIALLGGGYLGSLAPNIIIAFMCGIIWSASSGFIWVCYLRIRDIL